MPGTLFDIRAGLVIGLFAAASCENLVVFRSGLAANFVFDTLAVMSTFRNLAEFACGATFWYLNTTNVSMSTH